jgi:multisubunit Na+/H+ antiporter MnhE subunit
MRRLKEIAVWVLWWVGLALLWLLYQGEWNEIQLYAALSAGAVAATVALLVRAYARPSVRVELRLAARAGLVPWQILSQFAVVTKLLVRALVQRRVPTGEFRAVRFPTGGPRPGDRGRRVFVAMVVGYSPNSYVIDLDEERGLALVHVLGPVPPGQELL